jgi:deoxycytidine triphosphate deaminase
MILTGPQIASEIREGRIQFHPFDPKHCNPNSVNFHLGSRLLVYKRPGLLRRLWDFVRGQEWSLTLRSRNEVEVIDIPPEGIILQPGQLYLGSTVEYIGSTHYAPLMAARSSIGRLGLFIFLNSGLGDIGFQGQWTLELMTIHPIRLFAGDRIGQMMFFKPEGEVVQYSGKYQRSVGPVSSLIYQDSEASSSVFKNPVPCPACESLGRPCPDCWACT